MLRTAGWLGAAGLLVGLASAQPQQAQQDKPPIPDAPSSARPPQPFPSTPPPPSSQPEVPPSDAPPQSPPDFRNAPPDEAPPPAPPPAPPLNITTVPEGGATQPAPSPQQEELFKITTNVNQVLVPVLVQDEGGKLVSGLLPKDFSVFEEGRKQKLNFFTSDPFALSVAVILDVGMPDVAMQKVNKTFPSLQGAFSQFDEVAVYTYSSTYSKVSGYAAGGRLLADALTSLKTVRGRNNGPPVTGGPLGPQGPSINNIPVTSPVPLVVTPPRESHVLNDVVLYAALELGKRDRTRRKVIFIISDGREMGSNASYSDVLKVLLSNGIMVYGIGVEGAAIPIYGKIQQKIRIPHFGYSDILPKYANATGGEIYNELSQSAIDKVYSQVIGDARNQYTLGYVTPSTPSTAYRQIEVRVARAGCKNSDLRPCVNVIAKDGYYPAPAAR